jgi:hypothetical protein
MSGAGRALQEAAIEALQGSVGIGGVYDGPPLQAAFPYAVVEFGPESDWSHKSGMGREVRLALTIRDQGEKPARLHRLMEEAEQAMAGLGGMSEGWRIASLRFARSQVVREPGARVSSQSWAGAIEYRARMLALEPDA